jgi:ubiquinone/menaquinone biosynthesis C-methylase UbiE
MPVFNFDQIADQYDDYYDTELGRQVDHVEIQLVWQFMTRMALEKPFLEVGCGTGHWTKFFRQKGLELTAIDVSEKMLEKARAKNPKNVRFEMMNVENMNFPSKTFDNVVTIATLEFVDDMEAALHEIFRVLKPGGFFLAGCLNELSDIGQRKEENDVFKDARFLTPDQLSQFLSRFGDAEIDGCAIIEKDRVADYPDIHRVDKTTRLEKGSFLAGLVQKTRS